MNVTIVNLFIQLLHGRKEEVNGRPRSFAPARFSLTITLNTVPKRDSDERRVIVDLSWPCGSSVNDGIPGDSFLGEPISLTYPTIDSIVDAVISLGPGCLLYKRDLKKAYRQFPVDPRDYHLLGYTWDNQFYFDTVLTMGCFMDFSTTGALFVQLSG